MSSSKKITVNNSYNGQEIAVFQAASLDDINDAYESAAENQKNWAEVNPYQVNTILNKSVQILKDRYNEIIDLLVKESGSTLIKAHVVWIHVLSSQLIQQTIRF